MEPVEEPVTPPRQPQRHAPYDKPVTNYHWQPLCNVRRALVSAYDGVYDLHTALRAGHQITERDTKRLLTTMADLVTCGACGDVVPRLDSSSFVARCGHVYHKQPQGCWEKAGRNCCVESCRR